METAELSNMILLDQDIFFIDVIFMSLYLLTNVLTADEDM